MDANEKLYNANFRFERFNGEFNVYVEDKTIGFWYLVASHIKTFEEAVEQCKKYIKPQENEQVRG